MEQDFKKAFSQNMIGVIGNSSISPVDAANLADFHPYVIYLT